MKMLLVTSATLILFVGILSGCAEDSRDFNAPAENELYKLLVTKPAPNAPLPTPKPVN